MSDHEFEKSVQRKMDGLKLRPSDAVWQAVEMNLHRDKRRRRAFFWLPAAGILLLIGGYFLYSGSTGPVKDPVAQTQESAANTSSTQPSVQPATRENAPVSNPEQHSTAGGHSGQELSERQPEPGNAASAPSTNHNDNIISNHNTSRDRQSAERIAEKPNQQAHGTMQGRVSGDNNVNKQPKNKIDGRATATSERAKIDFAATQGTKSATEEAKHSDPFINNSLAGLSNEASQPEVVVLHPATVPGIEPLQVLSPADIASMPDSTVRVEIAALLSGSIRCFALPVPPKWQWGIAGIAGVNNISEGSVFDLLNAVRVEDVTNAAPAPAFTGIPPVPVPEASPIRTGPVFTAGAFVQRNFSRSLSLSIGLQYTYASAYTKVGKRVDSLTTVNYGTTGSRLTNQYYRADRQMHDYTNRYHFIELPIDLHVKLNRSLRTPITLSGGFTLSQLVYTNALHFDGMTRVYFENDHFFNKLQAGFQSGVHIGLFQRSNHPVMAGPVFRYFATNLQKKGETAAEGQHIWSAGLQVKMLLKK